MVSIKRIIFIGVIGICTLFATYVTYADVTLLTFNGGWDAQEGVILHFATENDIDHAAFHVWRSTENLDPDNVNTANATRVTVSPILSEYACQGEGSSYTFTDTAIEENITEYYYYLETIPCAPNFPIFYGDLMDSNSGFRVTNPNQRTQIVFLPVLQR